MKITYNWLKEYINFNYTPHDLAERLTMLGLEVETVTPVKLFFSGVIVGKILEISPHPNSQKLLLCKITTGKETLQIVCGARNISVGDLVPTAVIGAVLADKTVITKRTILGIDSYGMLCSEKELGLAEGSDGILILSSLNTNGRKMELGKKIDEELDLNDTVLDINVTPNRSDALSIIGIAQEISAITGAHIKMPDTRFIENGEPTAKLINIDIKTPKLCPRYTARIIKGITTKASPFWMRQRLRFIGQRPINNIVDITNFVLIESGQPLHAFDYEAISGAKIEVRSAHPGEKIITIDGQTRELSKDTLVIADDKRPIALAGVMGGKETEVGIKTKDILIESAYFEPINIRKTSKKYGLTTESSYRFERSIDPELPPSASNRAAQLILSIAGGAASKKIIDRKKGLPKQPNIRIDALYFKRIVGLDIPNQKIGTILGRLGCEIKYSARAINVKPPAWRRDLTKKIDLTEEVARIYGYEKIKPVMPEALVETVVTQKMDILKERIYPLLTAMGLSEIITYSFINPKDLALLKISEIKSPIIKNPVDKDVYLMRQSLIPGVINTIAYNFNMGTNSIRIFEMGKCFSQNESDLFPKENTHLSIGITGEIGGLHWKKQGIIPDFFYMKGILEELLKGLHIENFHITKTKNPSFHPQRACVISINNNEVGIFGEIHPEIISNMDIKDHKRQIFTAEIRLLPLLEEMPEHPKLQPLPKFPSIKRDIAIILDKSTEGYDIINTVKGINTELIESVEIFDVYEGHPIPEGKKSIAYTITYRHKDKTLTDEEANNLHDIVRRKILESTPCEIRE